MSRKRSVLVLNNRAHYEPFHLYLMGTLQNLSASPSEASSWEEGVDRIAASFRSIDLVVVDPMMPNFDLQELLVVLAEATDANARPLVTLVQFHPNDALAPIEKLLEADARICRWHAPHEMAFVFNRLLFPENQNRREHPRALADVFVECTNQEGFAFRDSSFNVSLGGLFLRSFRTEPPGTKLSMSLRLELSTDPIECSGTVVHRKTFEPVDLPLHPSGMGIRFESMVEKDRRRLAAFLQRHLLAIDKKLQ